MKRHSAYLALTILLLSLMLTGMVQADDLCFVRTPPDINECYLRVFGRDATKDEKNYWCHPDIANKFPCRPRNDRAAAVNDIVNELKNYFYKPEGQNELRDTINRSYASAFNRTPTTQDFAFWVSEIKKKRLGYRELMEAHKKWIMSSQGDQYRADMVKKVYPEVYGRAGTENEMNRWNSEIKLKGYTNDQLRGFLYTWYTGSSAEQMKELTDTIKRAYRQASLPVPGDNDVKNAVLYVSNNRPLFNQLVSWVKIQEGKLPAKQPGRTPRVGK